MHWADSIAEELAAKAGSHVIASGTSISGVPHLGNACDVIRGEFVRRALTDAGAKAELIWIADDSDPFRKVPAGLESLKDYIGFPVQDIPDPDGCHKNFVEHFVRPFLDDLADFDIKPTPHSGRELYKKGELDSEIKLAFKGKDKIREILNEFRKTELPADWIPWSPVCAGCGKISTTRATEVSGNKVKYVCEGAEVSGADVAGCSHKGESDPAKGEGKLPWRVEWAARWRHFKVTAEPFGKEHATKGGSFDTSKRISEEVFDYPAPYPVVYEFFTIGGAKISSSKGNAITLTDWKKIAEPQVLNYFMAKKIAKQRDVDLTKIPNLTDEYDEAETAFYGDGEAESKRKYELAQVDEPAKLGVPYTLCAVLSQIIPEGDGKQLAERVNEMGYEGFDSRRLVGRVSVAGEWVKLYGPDHLKFELISEAEAAAARKKLGRELLDALNQVAGELDSKHTPETLHKQIYETARAAGVKPPELFKALYGVLIGKERGPKAAMFLLSLPRADVKSRLVG